MRKLTTSEFIEKANIAHNYRYNYSKTIYKGQKEKVCIICPEHGEFWQYPSNHLKGCGCPKCSGVAKHTTEEFIEQSNMLHNHKYDYSKTVYKSLHTPVCIICPEHGEFKQTPFSHLHSQGCPKCGKTYMDEEYFKEKASQTHNNYYDYSKVKYINAKTPVCIVCPEHGEFWQTPSSHLNGAKCPKCDREQRAINSRMGKEEFISRASKLHNNKYDYSKVVYVNNSTQVCIICPEHGEFWQTPASHLKGSGCRKCAKNGMDTKYFIEKANEQHNNKYDYSKVKYVNSHTPVCIVCPEHGEFWQTPNNHLNGKGCPKCSMPNWDLTTEEFIEKAALKHNNKYDYSKTIYSGITEKVTIICPEHGEFEQIAREHLQGAGCPICNVGFLRSYKLTLLKNEDLLHMSSHQLIEIIANKKLPNEFRGLVTTTPDSNERAGSIQTLIDLFSDDSKTDEEVENEAEEIAEEAERELESTNEPASEMGGEFVLTVPEDEEENEETEDDAVNLPTIVVSNAHTYDDLLHMKPSDEAAKFIVLEETHKLWNSVLTANENGNLEDAINTIRNEEGGEFWKYIQSTFLNEYESVSAITIDSDYCFPYAPSLMQKLMAYNMINNKSYGNWCGTGAGKTNAFLFSTRKTNSRVTVAIVPNDVIDTLVKAIRKIYPNSDVFVPQSVDEIPVCNPDRFSYIIYNYEKFQGNNGAEDTINRLLESNKIDFICLDEVQNVKVRDIETASSRSQFITDLITRGRILNPEMRTLVMSATPCINNLMEVRSIVELLEGVEHPEIGNRNSISNIHNAYKALLLNGFRYVPKYPIIIDEKTVEIDCSNDANLYLALTCHEKGDISGIEYTLAKKKLDAVKNELRNGTIVYATWVDGMAQLLTKEIRSWGYSVESYNGESGNKDGRKEILDRFLNGKTQVLGCSKPISTGVDGLQEKCNKMVIVSLPWTDADYTQLKGRIYRQGSKFDRVEFVIPQIIINTPSGVEWSWDKMRKHAIDTKRSLGSAVVDGIIQESYTINKERLLAKAMEALNEGLEDIETTRKPIAATITYTAKEREYSESFVNDIHRRANTSTSNTTHERFTSNREEFKEYHRQREISKQSWVEDPVDRVAEIIGNMSGRYTRIIDMGCGLNKLKSVVDSSRMVQGVDHINVSADDTVIEADMSNLEGIVANNSMDVAVFCLSLWGTNYKDYFKESYRILDEDGKMIIVEPSSKFGENEHFNTTESFIDMVESYGFEKLGKVENRNNFVYFKFAKM